MTQSPNAFAAESARKAERLFALPSATAVSIFLTRSLGRVTVAFSVPPRKGVISTSAKAQTAPAYSGRARKESIVDEGGAITPSSARISRWPAIAS